MASVIRALDGIGRGTVRGLDEIGYAATLLAESIFWIGAGRRLRQKIRMSAVIAQMAQIGIEALPIATLLSATIGIMLAIQGIYTLGIFGAESFVYIGIAMAVTREFAPLIIGILVAGRSGSAIAARLSTMSINQEIDALRAMGINPVRFLLAPALIGMMVMVPVLTIWSDIVSIVAAGLLSASSLDISLSAFLSDIMSVLSAADILHGLVKSVIFALLIVLIGAVNGTLVQGGAEGVGRVTTRAVVQSISAIIVTDMIVVFLGTPT